MINNKSTTAEIGKVIHNFMKDDEKISELTLELGAQTMALLQISDDLGRSKVHKKLAMKCFRQFIKQARFDRANQDKVIPYVIETETEGMENGIQ